VADGDYERGRGREIAFLKSRLRAFAKARAAVSPDVLVFNGWAASSHAWDLCRFMSRTPAPRLFSYVDQLDGLPEAWISRPKSDDRNPKSKVLLVGWSMGGSTALRLACRHPDRVAGLVLLAATPRMMEDRGTGWRGMNERRLEALRKGLELTHGEGFFGLPAGVPNPYLVDGPENLERGLAYLLATDIRADLEHVFGRSPQSPQSNNQTIEQPNNPPSFPVFVFQSARDGIVRPENAAYLKTVFPQARVTMVPGAEHALPIQIPREIDDAVDACLAVAAQG